MVNQQTPTFSWQAATDQGSAGVTYQLYIDGLLSGANGQTTGAVITGTSYTIPDILPDGPHTWRVRARDAVGNVTDSSARTFTVDTTRPEQFRLSSPGNGACSMTPTPNLCWFSASDLGGVGGYQLWIDGALASSTTGPTGTCATPSSALSPGLHSWYVVANDRVGNARQSMETFQVLIDYRAPTAPSAILAVERRRSPDPPMFAWGAALDAGGLARYQIFVDGGAVATLGLRCAGLAASVRLSCRPTLLVRGRHRSVWAEHAVGGREPSRHRPARPTAPRTRAPDTTLDLACRARAPARRRATWSACAGAVSPRPEICNKQDDDCDGVVAKARPRELSPGGPTPASR